jgi:hypothetical protein
MPEDLVQLSSGTDEGPFEPKIVAFFCNGVLPGRRSRGHFAIQVRAQHPSHPRDVLGPHRPAVHPGRVRKGADGVLIGGCHPATATTRKAITRPTAASGPAAHVEGPRIEEDRFRLEWISAAPKATECAPWSTIGPKLRALGPLKIQVPQRRSARRCLRNGRQTESRVYWCASCGGCEEAVVDLAEKILT